MQVCDSKNKGWAPWGVIGLRLMICVRLIAISVFSQGGPPRVSPPLFTDWLIRIEPPDVCFKRPFETSACDNDAARERGLMENAVTL